MKNLVIIQARMGSSRLPGKVLMELAGKTVLECVVERVRECNLVDEILVATTIEKENLPLIAMCAGKGIRVFCGSENDVLDRFYQAARLLSPENVIRITADCPLLDASVLERIIRRHQETEADYTSNTIEPTYPDGLDCEIMKFSVLCEAWREAKLASQREHVTQYMIHQEKYKRESVKNETDYSKERWTIDTLEDYQFVSNIYVQLGEKSKDFHAVIDFLDDNPGLRDINSGFERNEGLMKSLKNDYIIDTK